MRRAAALRPDLHDAPVLARRREHCLAFDNIDADRFLAINIRARFARGDHVQRVPMIGRTDEYDNEILLLEHLAVIAVRARFLFGKLARRDHVGAFREHRLVHIAERNDFDRRDLDEAEQIGLPIPPAADQSDAFFRIGEVCGETAQRRKGEAGGGAEEIGGGSPPGCKCACSRVSTHACNRGPEDLWRGGFGHGRARPRVFA